MEGPNEYASRIDKAQAPLPGLLRHGILLASDFDLLSLIKEE